MSDTSDLESKVADWLGKQGYRLEYRTVTAFRNAGLLATMGSYVNPADQGSPREIDVSTIELHDRLLLRVFCECKYSAQSPWVLLKSGIPAHLESDWGGLPKSENLSNFPTSLLDRFRQPLESCWHFEPSQHFAHSLVQALRNGRAVKADEPDKGRDIAFDSLRKIATAAWDYATTPIGDDPSKLYGVIVIPCLVVEAPLMHAWFDENTGSFVVESAKTGRLHWTGCRGVATAVDVVHASALEEYAEKLHGTLGTLRGMLTEWHLEHNTPRAPQWGHY